MLKITMILLISGLLFGCSYDSHSQLDSSPVGLNTEFSKSGKPDKIQIALGRKALEQWHKASSSERCHLVDAIILGRTLIGMKAEEVISTMGQPDGAFVNTLYEPGITRIFGYSAKCAFEDQGDLNIELDENGQVCKAYLSVNH